MGNELRLAADGALKAFEPLASNAAGFKSSIEAVELAIAAQELEKSLANDDVIRGGVVVKFLMPFLEEMPADFLNMMAVHDIEDLISDALTITTASDGSQGQAGD